MEDEPDDEQENVDEVQNRLANTGSRSNILDEGNLNMLFADKGQVDEDDNMENQPAENSSSENANKRKQEESSRVRGNSYLIFFTQRFQASTI